MCVCVCVFPQRPVGKESRVVLGARPKAQAAMMHPPSFGRDEAATRMPIRLGRTDSDHRRGLGNWREARYCLWAAKGHEAGVLTPELPLTTEPSSRKRASVQHLVVGFMVACAVSVWGLPYVLPQSPRWENTPHVAEALSRGSLWTLQPGKEPRRGHDQGQDHGAAVQEDQPNVRACHNIADGPIWAVDDRGRVCKRSVLADDGCCPFEDRDDAPASLDSIEAANNAPPNHPSNGLSSVQYTCEGCNSESGCCPIYEVCVACCLNPSQEAVWKHTQQSADLRRYKSSTPFFLCQAACRTSSYAYGGGTEFRSDRKHCYRRDG